MENQVAEVKLKTDIVPIISERIELKKAGRNYKAPCPFHGEKTPSFMVSPELQIFKCFGCDEGGDVYTFLEKYEGMEFSEALKYLADRAGVKLAKSNFGKSSDKEKLIEINTQALRFYNYLLLEHPLGKKAKEYLLNDRGLKIETIREFQIGYSPENSLLLKKFLVDKKKIDPKDIEKAGIAILRGSNLYDRFNGRIIFPLFDHRGNPIGFSGRVLPWDRRETGKYINSPETPIYHKSSVLYGLNITRSFIKKKKVAIIVEGELDAISSYQAGIKNIVAIKGSALTEEQVRLLSRFAEKFILALDSDMAGDAAARRGITIASNIGVEVKIAEITNYKDPDEAARHDIDSYKKDLISSKGVWDFLIDSVFVRYKSETGAGKSKISKEMAPILSGIDDKIVQAHYANVLAGKLGVPLEAVTEQIEKSSSFPIATENKFPPEAQESQSRDSLLESRLLSLAFHLNPKILFEGGTGELIKNPMHQKIIEYFEQFSKKNTTFDITKFGKSLPKELFDGFAKMILTEEEDKKELDLVKKELKILRVKDELKLLSVKMREFENAGDKTKLLKAQKKFNKLAKLLSQRDEGVSGLIFNESQ